MNGLTGEQIDKIKARLDALECIQGILSRVRTLGDKDWRLGCIYNHTAYPLNDDQAEAAWAFVEHAPDDIAALLAHIDALEAVLSALTDDSGYVEVSSDDRSILGRQSCTYCYRPWEHGEPEHHDDDCPIARARALLSK